MTRAADPNRIDRAERVIETTPERVYAALLDPQALVVWRPPEGMTGAMGIFEPREGGRYQMTLTYTDGAPDGQGKSGDNADVVDGQFVALVPNHRIVERVIFRSDDPAFAGAMTITTTLDEAAKQSSGGRPSATRVAMACENVPPGISPEDHQTGLNSALANLAKFLDEQAI